MIGNALINREQNDNYRNSPYSGNKNNESSYRKITEQ